MALSLYDVSVVLFSQTLNAVAGFLKKGAEHCQAKGIKLDDIVETRLYPDMRPFRFQLLSVAHHTRGAIQGVQAGVFTPPAGGDDLDYAGLQELIDDARSFLNGLSRESVDSRLGKDVMFNLGSNTMPFTAEGFLLSFSLPNMHFHATTAYDILRMKGVPLGKRDYLGKPQMKV
jgi:hypothetical protein